MCRFDLGEAPPQVCYVDCFTHRCLGLHACIALAVPVRSDVCLNICFDSGQVSGVKVYQAGEAQTADEIIVEFDFMWSGQQVRHLAGFQMPFYSHRPMRSSSLT